MDHPSVNLSYLTRDMGISVTCNLVDKGKKGSVGRVEKGSAHDRDHRREPQNLGTTGSPEHGRRRVTFILDFCLYQEKESNLHS